MVLLRLERKINKCKTKKFKISNTFKMEKMNKIKLLLRLTLKKNRVDNAGNKQDSVMKNNSGELIKIVW